MTDLIPAFGYLRTSSQTNVGEDKDSEPRQKLAINRAAARAGYRIKEWFYDADVRGDIEVSDRPAFMAMTEALASNGVRTVFVEEVGRFSRELTVAMVGIATLKKLDVTLLDGRGTSCTDPKDPMAKAMLQMMFVFAELDKNMTVAKLKGARDRASDTAGRRVEGRRGYTRGDPELVRLAKSLMAGRTLLATSAALADLGHVTASGRPFSASQVKRLVEARAPALEKAQGAPPQSRHATILAELDARNAPDADYRAAFSTGAKVALKRGETWRGRLEAWVRAETPARPLVSSL
jgi:DNA invertase Pin-like site-specific DNA recombinase